ncbi:hypothetical protein OK074_5305 [Actinobacteria bacterium OK074]|nr:hypothetical protein OK074_5305 [Actinobacteria bacterium OK074]
MNRRAATTFVLLSALEGTIGIVFTATQSRASGAPLFWLTTGSLALAWYFERRAGRRN